MPNDNTAQRIQRLQKELAPHQAFLLSYPSDVTYFLEFEFLLSEEREAFLCVTSQTAYLIKATFSPAPPGKFFTIKNGCRPENLAKHMKDIVTQESLQEVLFDASTLFVEEWQKLTAHLKETTALKPMNKEVIWQLRMIKDETEVAALQKAGQIASQVIQELVQEWDSGVTEKHLAQRLEEKLSLAGSQRPAFPIIVAFGGNAAEPHYQPGNVPLQKETAVLIDFGATVHGYRSDMTRTYWFGDHPEAQFAQVAETVNEAYQAAFKLLDQRIAEKTPITAKEVDQAARQVIEKAGFGEYFIHTTGHGVGLDIHEPPSLNWQNENVLQPGMVITIEPGIYLTEKLGYRHENTILITPTGAEELTVE